RGPRGRLQLRHVAAARRGEPGRVPEMTTAGSSSRPSHREAQSPPRFDPCVSGEVSARGAACSPPAGRYSWVISYPPRWGMPRSGSGSGRRECLERLAARGDAELPQQALDVRADRVLGDEEAGRDVGGVEAGVQLARTL